MPKKICGNFAVWRIFAWQFGLFILCNLAHFYFANMYTLMLRTRTRRSKSST